MGKVEKVFKRLRKEGRLKIARNIAIDRRVPNFEADNGLFKKTINYNIQMNELSEEDIEMCLLHEEGHLRYPYNKKETFLLVWPLLLLLLTMICFSSLDKLFPSLILLGAILMFIFLCNLHKWFREIGQRHEYLADEFAFKNVSDPLSRISSFNHVTKRRRAHKLSLRDCIGITLGYGQSHPLISERKERIKRIFQKK
jgi:Zn-dependent protease with chaperone function